LEVRNWNAEKLFKTYSFLKKMKEKEEEAIQEYYKKMKK
jgi:hypothetical protein